MREHPIVFSAQMVRAILDGPKTQTRRIVKAPKGTTPDYAGVDFGCPYGAIGDCLWVKEQWQVWTEYNHLSPSELPSDPAINYTADGNTWDARLRSALHMPRNFSRITLEIVGVRVERLSKISNENALAEGIIEHETLNGYRMCHIDSGPMIAGGPRVAYRHLWESIYGPGSWELDPWVWVIEFKRLS